jgi:hypothetical protein
MHKKVVQKFINISIVHVCYSTPRGVRLLVQSRENGFPTSLSAMLPNLTKYKEFYSGQLPDREDP